MDLHSQTGDHLTGHHIVADLETFGHVPGSALTSLGAVAFTFDGHRAELLETFYQRIDLDSCLRYGLFTTGSTIAWWFTQSDAARAEITLPGIHLSSVLSSFSIFLRKFDKPCLWGNGSDFDNAQLAAAYHAIRMDTPWPFGKSRCLRTLKNLHPHIKAPELLGNIKHHALWDAKTEAEHLALLLAHEHHLQRPHQAPATGSRAA